MFRSLLTIGRLVGYAFSIVGFVACILVVMSCLPTRGVTPCYSGQVYDCRHANWAALREVVQLLGREEVATRVAVYQYPGQKATVVSLDWSGSAAAFVFHLTPVTVREAQGELPSVKASSLFDLAQR